MENKALEIFEKWLSVIKDAAEFYTNLCKSPIEQILAVQFFTMGKHDVYLPQFVIENDGYNYKLDFASVSVFQKNDEMITLKIAIECDGHDFHEKTKEQAKHDKERDRILMKLGWHVLHYTGSEIFNDPEKVYFDIQQFRNSKINELKNQGYSDINEPPEF